MSKDLLLREFVNARLTVAAEEIFAQFDRTISEYREELGQLKEENQRKQQLLDSILSPSIKLVRVDTHFPPGPDEPHIKQEEEHPFTESTVVCIKREESPAPLQQRQTEHQEQTQREDFSSECDVKCENSFDDDKAWVNPISSPDCSEFEDNGDHYVQNQIRNNKSAPETCVFENSGVMLGSDGGAECNNPQSIKIFNDSEGDKSKEQEQPVCKRNDSNSQSHMEDHVGESPFTCSTCMQSFSTICDFSEHIKVHNTEKPYTCSICSKAFPKNSNLKRHSQTHSDEKPFRCTVCEKQFRKPSHLQLHMRTHTGEKPFRCTVCNSTFSQKSTLDRHTRIHTGEKPYSCTVCNKTFLQKNNLIIHRYRLHTDEKPFSCGVCSKTFSQKSALDRHTGIHTGEKPFKCTLCSKTFLQRNHLNVHTDRVHMKEKPFSCGVCNKTFRVKSDLNRHSRSHQE